MMRPPSFSKAKAFCARKYTPLKWMLTISSNCASVISAMGALRLVPALLIRKSKRSVPNVSARTVVTCAKNASKVLRSAAQGHGTLAQGFDGGDHRGGFGLLTAVSQDDVYALLSELQGHILAQAAAAASYEGDFGSTHEECVLQC